MSDASTATGTCFCGAVEVTVSGEPAAMGYCHCRSCRTWAASPVNAFTLWKSEAVRISKGVEHVGSYSKSPNSIRKWCRECGGHLLTEHPLWELTDVYAAVIPSVPFRPTLHVHYQETVLPMRDGLPKQRDFPTELGGSGQLLAE